MCHLMEEHLSSIVVALQPEGLQLANLGQAPCGPGWG